MKLWIRSQYRELLRVNPELEIYEYGKENFLVIDTKGCTSYDKAKVLGKYKTKERALEVLDEIQNALLNKWANNVKYEEHYDDEKPSILIYQMPKE